MSITYPSNKYTTSFSAKQTTNLYDMAQEYKKKNTDFDKSLVYDEKINKTRQLPSDSVVKDIFSASGKFFSRKFLLYDTTVIKFSELQAIFKVKEKMLAFESKRTIEFLNMIYSKLKLNIKASQDLVGKKINLYFPKDTNSTWFIRKYISIESSSAPIELVEVGDIVQNEVSNYNSYNVELKNTQDGGVTDVIVNGGKVRVKRENNDESTWIKSSYTKSTQNSESKKMGWGKIIVDLPVYNSTIIDVYKESIAEAQPGSLVEVAFPVYATIEDMLTNKSLYDRYNTYLFDNANFFNTAIISLLRNIPSADASVLKKISDLLFAGENKTNKKIVGKLSRTMGLYLGLKRAYVGILRKIRALFDAFSIKDLNRLLNAINSFNNKRNYIIKKKSKTDVNGRKSFYTETEYLKLNDIKDYVDQKNFALVTSEFSNNDIKWGVNKIFNLKSETDITSAIKSLIIFYNDNRVLDPLNYFSTLSPDVIAREVVADLTDVKMQAINRNLLDFNKNGQSIWSKHLADFAKILPGSAYSYAKASILKYESHVKDLILKMIKFTSNILTSYLTKADPNKGLNVVGLTRYINENIGIYFLDNHIEMAKKLVYKIITENVFGYAVNEQILDGVLVSVTYDNLTEQTKKDISQLDVNKRLIDNIRTGYSDSVTNFLALVGNLEKWAYKTSNIDSFDLGNLNSKNLSDVLKIITNLTKITFKQPVYDALTAFEAKNKNSSMDLQYSNVLSLTDNVVYMLDKGLETVIDIEALKIKKLEEREENVVQNQNIIPVSRIEISSESANMLLEDNIAENFDEAEEDMGINYVYENEIKNEDNTNMDLREVSKIIDIGVGSETTATTKEEKKDKKKKKDKTGTSGMLVDTETSQIQSKTRTTRFQSSNLGTGNPTERMLSNIRKKP